MNLPPERIYRKTERGLAALNTRSGGLPARGRTALILVNGRESLALLADKIGPDVPALLEMLLGLGLIEEALPAAAPVRAKPPMPAPAAEPSLATGEATLARLSPLKREAVHRLAPQFGPDVDVVCRALLAARTEAQYREALLAIESKLAIYLGRKPAQRLLDALRI